jgi:hypothetical protein
MPPKKTPIAVQEAVASLHRIESRCTGLYLRREAFAMLRLLPQARVRCVVESPYVESQLV